MPKSRQASDNASRLDGHDRVNRSKRGLTCANCRVRKVGSIRYQYSQLVYRSPQSDKMRWHTAGMQDLRDLRRGVSL